MRRFHFSTRGALGATLVIAVALAALRANSDIIAGLAVCLYAVLLCLAVVATIVCRDDRRVFWTGFAVFGWVYAGAVYFTEPVTTYSRAAPGRVLLPTTRALEWLAGLQSYTVGTRVMAIWRGGGWYSSTIVEYDRVAGLYRVQWDDGSAPEWVNASQMQLLTSAGLRGGHAILGPLLAAVGGLISYWCFGTGEQRDPG